MKKNTAHSPLAALGRKLQHKATKARSTHSAKKVKNNLVHVLAVLEADEGTHLQDLQMQLLRFGFHTGHRGVNNTNVMKFALFKWKEASPEDGRAFSEWCEQGRLRNQREAAGVPV